MKFLFAFFVLVPVSAFSQSDSPFEQAKAIEVEVKLTRAEVKAFVGELTSDLVQEARVFALLKSLLGSGLSAFIKNTAASVPAIFVQGKYLLASGCIKGNCAGNESFFVIYADDSDAVMVRNQVDGVNTFISSPAFKKLPAGTAQELSDLFDRL